MDDIMPKQTTIGTHEPRQLIFKRKNESELSFMLESEEHCEQVI
jgi:hypothetical protein